MNKDNIIGFVAIIAIVLGGWALSRTGVFSNGIATFGVATSATGMLAENYIPYVMYNNGYNSAKDIATTGNINGAAGTFSGLLSSTGTFSIGSGGTAQVNQVITTCSMIANNSITATSTGYAYCTGVTGVTSADYISASFATSTLGFASVGESFVIINAKASTTAAAIDFTLLNLTGGTVVPSAAGRLASTTVIRAGH